MNEPFDPRVTPWQIDESEFYEIESFHEQMRFLLQYAVLAPSGHNTQPWSFRIVKEGLEVFADYERRLPVIDPSDRELLMSIGAAIMNFRVAAAHFGFETNVMYDPRPEEQTAVAVISAVETCSPDGSLTPLFGAISKRRTNRALFDAEPIEPRALSHVCEVIDRFPETLRLILPQDKNRVAGMVEESARVRMARPAFRAEIADWIRADDGQHSDGISSEALGVPHVLAAGATWFLRQFDFGEWQAPRDRRLAESASALILVTGDDERVPLIRAGEAMERLLLTITDVGLQYSFINHPVAVKGMRERIGDLAGASQPAQLLIRIGFAPAVEQPMPRRDLDSVIARTE
jgi:hypothetical protein